MHMDKEVAAERSVLLVDDVFNHGIQQVARNLDICLFFSVTFNDRYLLNSLLNTDSLPFQLFKW